MNNFHINRKELKEIINGLYTASDILDRVGCRIEALLCDEDLSQYERVEWILTISIVKLKEIGRQKKIS